MDMDREERERDYSHGRGDGSAKRGGWREWAGCGALYRGMVNDKWQHSL
jgi:hypothetical protein